MLRNKDGSNCRAYLGFGYQNKIKGGEIYLIVFMLRRCSYVGVILEFASALFLNSSRCIYDSHAMGISYKREISIDYQRNQLL
jgi:hypothetical protein